MSSGIVPENEVPRLAVDESSLETAPSQMHDEEPQLARIFGIGGMMLATMGLMVILLNALMGARYLTPPIGYIGLFFGLCAMLYHAARDGDQQVRRSYAIFGLAWLFFAAIITLWPGGASGSSARSIGYYFMPYATAAILVALLFLMAFTRHETNVDYRNGALLTEFVIGAILMLSAIIGGMVKPEFLIGPGLVLSLLGLAYVCVCISQLGAADGVGHYLGIGLGLVGAFIATWALARSILPVLAKPEAARNLFILGGAFLSVAGLFLGGIYSKIILSTPDSDDSRRLVRFVMTGVGVVGLIMIIIGIFGVTKIFVGSAIPPYFVPYGLIFLTIGVIYLICSLGISSDHPFVVLTRKELSGFFYSPIGYLVIFGFALMGGLNYFLFIGILGQTQMNERGIEQAAVISEPIVRYYIYSLLPVMAIVFAIPALTMRIFSEEQRAGTMEVLFTAPIQESTVVMSKFVACWIFYLVLWIPWAFYLIALRIESGQAFDYRPLLSFFLMLTVHGASFLSMGLFFSSITRNQIIAAVLTFSGMMVFTVSYFLSGLGDIAEIWKTLFRNLSFLDQWQSALSGRLPVPQVFLQLSLASFWLYLTVKVLESRRWK